METEPTGDGDEQRGVGWCVWIGCFLLNRPADRRPFLPQPRTVKAPRQTDQQTVTTTAEQCHLDAEEEVVSAVEAPVEEGVEVAVGEEGGAFVMKGHPTRLSVSVHVAGLLFLNMMSASCV